MSNKAESRDLAIRELSKAVVEVNYPDDVEAFNVAADDLISAAKGRALPARAEEEHGHLYEFAPDFPTLVGCVSAVVGIVTGLMDIWDRIDRKRVSRSDAGALLDMVFKSLVANGVAPEKAQEILASHKEK